MGKPLIVLADPDVSYLAPLECKFLEELQDVADLEVITDEGYLDDYLASPHEIEVLVVAEEWFRGYLDMQNIEHAFVFVEEQEGDHESTCNLLVDYLFKYSSSNLIFSKIVGSSARLRDRGNDDKEAQIVMFYSPVGGSGKTTMALGVSACLQSMYKRVFYLDAEYVQTFECYLRNGKNAPNAMAHEMMSSSGALYERMMSYIASDCFDYLPALRMGLAAYDIPFEFFSRFAEAVRDSGRYDYVVVDTDSSFGAEKASLFNAADRIVVSVMQDASSLYKTTKFLDNLDAFDEENYHFICNKYQSEENNAFQDSASGSAIVLDGYVEFARDLVDADAMLWGDNAGVKRLAMSLI